jgi:hypothetical protein
MISKKFRDVIDEYAEIAELIAEHFGRAVSEPDYDLAARIVAHMRGERAPTMHRDPTYGWKPDERA